VLQSGQALLEYREARSVDLQRMARVGALGRVLHVQAGGELLTQAALPHLTASKGAIVNVSSTFGAKPAPGMSQYGASKAALDQLTRSWALELADRGIRVNAVSPGPTETGALQRSGRSPAQIEEIKARERQRIPLGRRGEPEDVAYWVVALADPAANWMTGQIIGIDGGYLLG
jgi:NAD(P)-dependent dehydrogenase (short-subunit alcohol dehydrogenase family)